MKISLRVFHGPSVHAPFAAVIAQFTNPFQHQLAPSVVQAQWRMVSDRPLWEGSAQPPDSVAFEGLACLLAVHLQHPDEPQDAAVRIEAGTASRPSSMALGFADPGATSLVLQTAIDLAEKIFLGAAEDTDSLKRLAPRLRQVQAGLQLALPHAPVARTLARIARRRAIPVYPVAENSRIWLFGQGSAGAHFFSAAGQADSMTGTLLARDKLLSNRLVRRLGFPGVTHLVASNEEQAIAAARRLGYPVVLKPISSGKGKGVSAYVMDDSETGVAFANAAASSRQGVIVERHVAGDDHRLAVFGGKLAWVAARYPASVTGDGLRTVAELIEAENHRRRRDPAATDDGLRQLEVDPDVIVHLRKHGLSPDSLPPAGTVVSLRSVANIAKGGSIADVTHLAHPDNIHMAEAIARSFRMDAMGVDFMTPDISRSWREVPCAVIEVNGTPGIFYDSRAEKILLARFPAGSDGRIPSVLLIDAPAGVVQRICALLAAKGLAVGQTSGEDTMLAGHKRCQRGDDLPARVMALICDPGCDALVIEVTAGTLDRVGLPLDRLDLVLGFQALSPQLRSVVQSCSTKFIDAIAPGNDIAPLLDAVLQRYGLAFQRPGLPIN
ncbi:hypothetical protein [Caenimonas sp. SL110]|uniref:ATP-binding protein n=1 Tax=Caenimonas sp. SL110 TaxID=1450524 RepID=UPI0006533A73|nr:hypothetical protein [Caenimonas sp. SL110]